MAQRLSHGRRVRSSGEIVHPRAVLAVFGEDQPERVHLRGLLLEGHPRSRSSTRSSTNAWVLIWKGHREASDSIRRAPRGGHPLYRAAPLLSPGRIRPRARGAERWRAAARRSVTWQPQNGDACFDREVVMTGRRRRFSAPGVRRCCRWGALANAADLPQLGKSPTADVVAAMTRQEKVNLVIGTGMELPGLPPEMRGPVVGETKAGIRAPPGRPSPSRAWASRRSSSRTARLASE